MDTDAIIASALDIIADECTLKNDMGEVLQIKSSNEDTQKILYNLFYDVLNIEFNLWSWIRQMCKYGDFFLKLEIAEKFGVYNIIPYTAYHIMREEHYDPKNPAEVRYRFSPDGFSGGATGFYGVTGTGTYSTNKSDSAIYFDNYEMAHFRLITDVNYLPYGRSYLEPARKLFKQYILMEDAMLIHRIVRAPEKRVFYVNVGSIPPNEVENFMQKTISQMKRTPFQDPQTGEYNLKYNLQNSLEDFFIPIRGNDTTTNYLSNIVINDGIINPNTSSNTMNLAFNQTSGALNLGTIVSRTGDVNIATGAGNTCNVNIHNGTSSSGSVAFAIGTSQATTINIQSTTGTGTVTIGNSSNAIALNGAVTLARPLGLGSLPTSGQLGWRTENLMTNPTTPFVTGTSSVPLTARSFTFPISGLLFVELRLQATTASISVLASLTQTTNSLNINSEKTVALGNPTGSVTTLSLTTTLTAGGTWYVTVRSAANNTTFNNFYLYATRIG
jgi:hypothetical protein